MPSPSSVCCACSRCRWPTTSPRSASSRRRDTARKGMLRSSCVKFGQPPGSGPLRRGQRPLVGVGAYEASAVSGNGSIINGRGISDSAVWAAAGRARDPVHRGVLSRFPPQEDGGRSRPAAGRSRSPDPDGRGRASRRSARRSCPCRSRSRTSSGHRRPIRSSPISSSSSRTSSQLGAGACSISGSAAPARTGAARGTSAPSPRSRKSGRSTTASTRSSSRPRTASTRCAARSRSWRSTWSASSRTRSTAGESKVFLSKRLGQHVIDSHRSRRSVQRNDD